MNYGIAINFSMMIKRNNNAPLKTAHRMNFASNIHVKAIFSKTDVFYLLF